MEGEKPGESASIFKKSPKTYSIVDLPEIGYFSRINILMIIFFHIPYNPQQEWLTITSSLPELVTTTT